MQRLLVAGVPIDMTMNDVAFFNERYSAYFASADGDAAMRMTVSTADNIQPTEGKELLRFRNVTVVELPDGKRCHYMYYKNPDRLFQSCVYKPDFSETNTVVARDQLDGMSEGAWEHSYAGFDFACRLAALGGAVLHGSAIAYKGRGVIFSAPSGTGKSTHTGLWKKCFGDDVEYINDDKPALRFEKDEIRMYGTPWSGKTSLNLNKHVPLHAVVFVTRGEHNSLRRLDFTESLCNLQWQVVQPYHDAEIGSGIADRMIELAQRVPVYVMTCNMEDDAAYTARNALFGE